MNFGKSLIAFQNYTYFFVSGDKAGLLKLRFLSCAIDRPIERFGNICLLGGSVVCQEIFPQFSGSGLVDVDVGCPFLSSSFRAGPQIDSVLTVVAVNQMKRNIFGRRLISKWPYI